MVLNTPVVGVSALDALADTARADLDVDGALVRLDGRAARRGLLRVLPRRRVVERPRTVRSPSRPPIVGAPAAILDALPFATGDRVTSLATARCGTPSIIEATRGSDARI